MRHRGSRRLVAVWLASVVISVLCACGADPTGSAASPEDEIISLPAPDEPIDAGTTGTTDASTTTAGGELVDPRSAGARAAPALALQVLGQPAVWPGADVVFTTPEEAAADFVSSVLISEGDPTLGEFQAGDARSGEIAVLYAGETGDLDPPLEKGLLLLRRIAPTDGWYVIAAQSDGVVIDAPTASAEVPAGALTVSGEGRGFEGTLAVSAFAPGDVAARLDLQIGAGGAMSDLEPYSVDLDLSAAAPGDVVVVLVKGDTGLGDDPSTFAALPVVIAPAAPVTIPATR